jgi:hypothetical protein
MLEKRSSYKKLGGTLIVFLVVFGSSIIRAEESKVVLSVEEIRGLVPQIKAAETRLSNLKVESEAWVEEKASAGPLSDPCEPWKRTPVYASTTGWFDGRPQGKIRVDVNLQVSEWKEGAAPYLEESYSVGFDGRYGRYAKHSPGHGGETYSVGQGEIILGRPDQLKHRYLDSCTGRQFSSIFFFGQEGYTFSQFPEVATSPAALEAGAFQFAREKFQGVECIRIGSGEQRGGHICYWLDPARGFALRGYDSIRVLEDGSERVLSRIRVTKLEKVTSNVWWPIEAYVESDRHRPGEPYKRTVYRASKVIANDPNFVEGIFTVPFPDGYFVDDKVNGKKYRAGQEQKGVEK